MHYSSSDANSTSSSADESKDKDELFKSLKFSDDILQQMNAKRQEIVGTSPVPPRRSLGINAQQTATLDQTRDALTTRKQSLDNIHAGIGEALPSFSNTKAKCENSISTHKKRCGFSIRGS